MNRQRLWMFPLLIILALPAAGSAQAPEWYCVRQPDATWPLDDTKPGIPLPGICPLTFRDRLWNCWDGIVDETSVNWWRVCSDYRNLYTGRNLWALGLAVAVAAPLANT